MKVEYGLLIAITNTSKLSHNFKICNVFAVNQVGFPTYDINLKFICIFFKEICKISQFIKDSLTSHFTQCLEHLIIPIDTHCDVQWGIVVNLLPFSKIWSLIYCV